MNKEELKLINKIVDFWEEYDSSLNQDELIDNIYNNVINNNFYEELKVLLEELGSVSLCSIEEKEIVKTMIYILEYMKNNIEIAE